MKKPIYLDYAATTPVAPEVITTMLQYLDKDHIFGNPHSTTHIYGFNAASAVEQARSRFAEIIHAHPTEIIYTSGATEANNLALQGIAHFHKKRGQHIISVQTEHKAVLDVLKFLQSQGFEVTYLPVNSQGTIDLAALKKAIRKDTILATVMMVNNETGVLHPIKDIAKILHEQQIFFHVDAAQALGKIPINVKELDIDLMSFSAHKIYGPKGIGALYMRAHPQIQLEPLFFGGGQEQNLRAGTLAPFLIAGFTKAAELCQQHILEEIKHIFNLKKLFWEGLKDLKQVQINSDFNVSIPYICNITFKDVDPESFLLALEEQCAISQSSACTSAHMEPSHVLRAMGLTAHEASCSFRFSFGRDTTEDDIHSTIKFLRAAL
jgi:cysteine desulfurase